MTDDARTLADALEELLRSLSGVSAIYPTAPAPAVVIGEILATTDLPGSAPPLIEVDVQNDGAAVCALIGVDDSTPAHETGRAVHQHIVDYLERVHTKTTSVTVRIGMVG